MKKRPALYLLVAFFIGNFIGIVACYPPTIFGSHAWAHRRGTIVDRNGKTLAESVDSRDGTARFYPEEGVLNQVIGRANEGGTGVDGIEKTQDATLISFPPKELYLTIDLSLQKILEESVNKACETLSPKGIVAILVAPKTGEILAMASRPNTTETNKAVTWMYEPGSTFKIVVAAAALNERFVDKDTKINCEQGSLNYAGKTIKDHQPCGDLTVGEILMKSSNIGSAKMALMMKDPLFYDYVRRFGFGECSGIDLPNETAGIVNPPSRWDEITKTRMAFGQSVAVSPIQLAMAYCAIANGGLLMKPKILLDDKPVEVRRVCSEDTAKFVREALKGTVSDQGTAPLARVDGVTVGGKTGTAQAIMPDGHYSEDKFVTSFAGFFPVEDPKYVCVVIVDQANIPSENNYGGLVAAPIFSEIAGNISKLK